MFIFFHPTPDTCEALKTAYRKLAILNHPDCGGDAEAMKTINAEYEFLFARLKDIHVNAEGETYTSRNESPEVPEDFINIINTLIRFEGVAIEIIGRFIWVSGNTKPYKEALKEMRFKWHSKKLAWFLAPEDYKKRNRKQYGMDDIRNMYGCQEVDTAPYTKIASA